LERQRSPDKAEGSYLVRLLDDLGYRASLHAVSLDQYFTDLSNPRTKIQASFAGWGADFPAPSTFFGPLASCQSADEPGTFNWAEFCDPHVDALASQARAAQVTDPAAARRLWAHADRIVTDQAPYVPLFNAGFAEFVSSRVGSYQDSRYTDRCSTRCGSGKTARTRSMPRARVSSRAARVSPDG
jgi:ABC-type oligopeptide transport system substrate-binding subunit